jgi:hypothetical protein
VIDKVKKFFESLSPDQAAPGKCIKEIMRALLRVPRATFSSDLSCASYRNPAVFLVAFPTLRR